MSEPQCCCNASWLDLDQSDCPIHGPKVALAERAVPSVEVERIARETFQQIENLCGWTKLERFTREKAAGYIAIALAAAQSGDSAASPRNFTRDCPDCEQEIAVPAPSDSERAGPEGSDLKRAQDWLRHAHGEDHCKDDDDVCLAYQFASVRAAAVREAREEALEQAAHHAIFPSVQELDYWCAGCPWRFTGSLAQVVRAWAEHIRSLPQPSGQAEEKAE